MGKNPAFQFYPGDWIQDTSVLTLEAKGAWIDLLCAMWRSETRGTLHLTIDQYSRLLRVPVETTKSILEELMLTKCGDIFCTKVTLKNAESNDPVTVSNRRMVREEKDRKNTRKRGEKYRKNKKIGHEAERLKLGYNGDNNGDITVPSSSSSSTSPPLPPLFSKVGITTDSCSETQKAASHEPKKTKPFNGKPVKNESETILTFPTQGSVKEWRLTKEHVEKWEELFPALDILGQCRLALAWCDANPRRQKTVSGMPKFLVGWLTKAQNRGTGPIKPVVLDMWDEPVTDEENEKGKEYYRLKEAQERMQEGEHDLDEVSGDDDITPF